MIESPVYLAGDVPLEAADDFLFGASLACSFGDVVSGGRIPVHSDEGDCVNGLVELPVAAAVQAESSVAAG